MTTRPTPREPWDDDRLAAAFAGRASRASTTADLAGATSAALRIRPTSAPVWRRLLTPAAVVILAVCAVTGGFALLGTQRGSSGLVEFRDGPTADMRTLDTGEFAFEYPADWLAYDSTAVGSGFSSIAVLGTQPVESRCRNGEHVDINCVYEQPLALGDIRVFVGTGAYRGGTVLDRADIENGTTTHETVAGMPAIRDEYDPQPESFYHEDLSVQWSIGRPAGLSNVVTIELRARERGIRPSIEAEARAALDAIIASFRFDATAFPSPSDWWAGRDAVGLPIISVSDAIAIRDGGIDDGEIAVEAWYAPYFPSRACGFPTLEQPVSPLQADCPEDRLWLMQDPEPVITVTDLGLAWRGPTGLAINPAFDDIDMSWASPIEDPARLVELVVVGHFDDRRSAECPEDVEQACRDRFVVDRIESVNGEVQSTSALELLEGAGTPFDEAKHTIEAVRPGVAILSAVHVDGDSGLRRIEPALAAQGSSLIQEQAVWVVRVLKAEVLETYLIVDSTGSIYELTPEGPLLVALSTPGERVTPSASPIPEPTSRPSPAWGPWPPQDAFSVMEFKDDAGRKAFVAIVDASGLLESVAEGVPDPEIGGETGEGFFRDPSGARRYRLRWATTICDREMTVSIAREVARVVIEHAPRKGCDTMAIGRNLVLQFTQEVDPAAVELQVIQPTLLPEPPPEPTTMVVELERGDATESVLVIDHAASLMEARAADPVPVVADFTGARIVRADDGGTIVLWNGALCDRDLWISIEADDPGPPDRIVVHGTSVETCRAALVQRAIWLDLGPVDVASIGVGLSVGPSSGGPRDAGPIIGVADALVVRSHGADDHQLQVRGWYWRDPVVYDCSVPPSPPPALESGCQGPHDRFLADREVITGAGFVVWLRPGVDTAMLRYDDPSEVVIVGHFDDTMSEACATSTRESCRDVFVIEEVLAASAP